jgi:uncharacterized protein
MRSRNKTSVFFQKVYSWMFIGLILSALTALAVIGIPALTAFVFANMAIFIGLLIAELILVIALVAALKKISSRTAKIMFVIYSLLNGLTISVVLLVYTGASVIATFFIAAIMFGSIAMWGFFTDKDLSKWGPILFMALIGLIIALVVNIFLKSTMMDLIVSIIGVLLFAGLTAYDNQYLKRLSLKISGKEHIEKMAIMGALKLYLDFINLFLFLLRILGKRR